MNYKGLRIAINRNQKPETINDLHFVSYDKQVLIFANNCYGGTQKQRVVANGLKTNLMQLIDEMAGERLRHEPYDSRAAAEIRALRDELLCRIDDICSVGEMVSLPQERIDAMVRAIKGVGNEED